MNKFKGTSGHIDLDAALALLVAKTARTQDEAGRDRNAKDKADRTSLIVALVR
jgi:hypothetical protein